MSLKKISLLLQGKIYGQAMACHFEFILNPFSPKHCRSSEKSLKTRQQWQDSKPLAKYFFLSLDFFNSRNPAIF